MNWEHHQWGEWRCGRAKKEVGRQATHGRAESTSSRKPVQISKTTITDNIVQQKVRSYDDEGPRCWLAHCPNAPSSHKPCSHGRRLCIAGFCIADTGALLVLALERCFACICIPDSCVLHSHCGRVFLCGADTCIVFTLRVRAGASACLVFTDACNYGICIAGARSCIAGGCVTH